MIKHLRNKPALIFALMLLPISVLADYHYTTEANVVTNSDEQLAAEITAFLADYEQAYNNQDYKTVKSMWHDDGNPIYMAEEVPFPLYGQDRINNYFNPRPGKRILDGIDNKYSKVRAKYLTPEIAVATYRLDYDIKLTGMVAMHGWDRVMAVFIKTNAGWKLTAYTEAPMGPATMVRKMMKATPAVTEEEKADYATTRRTIKSLAESSVSPEFDEFLEARKDLAPTH
ncbi:MAG: nuclear transport factor 2 family protein [Gammaproteobacteria bacterium]|nr:nuclear transport factor 2 family protein [Gammaproteobacteria bacterium]MCP4090521.1 nuclear transport factor 2 family protein [Gammaproteobacteria bacterium]MCP4276614.1 nuclear transport factor 2 family protein [Gammaproteobacteria bacterium]MCP4831320.1 nuclear transport factor 2 family protein [Gammaproteobacteria bacterium]MCP4927908.1 nuclear transport factor 2 family protein [Gammaproteobacteria bacterium]